MKLNQQKKDSSISHVVNIIKLLPLGVCMLIWVVYLVKPFTIKEYR